MFLVLGASVANHDVFGSLIVWNLENHVVECLGVGNRSGFLCSRRSANKPLSPL